MRIIFVALCLTISIEAIKISRVVRKRKGNATEQPQEHLQCESNADSEADAGSENIVCAAKGLLNWLTSPTYTCGIR